GALPTRTARVPPGAGPFAAGVWSGGGASRPTNRVHEPRTPLAAARAGVGAPVVAYPPADNLLVLRFIEGRTFGNSDVQAPANIPRIAQACRQLHAGPRFAGDFDMFVIQGRYEIGRASCRERVERAVVGVALQ